MVEDVVRSAAAVSMASGLALAAYLLAWRLAGPGRPLVRWVATAVSLAWLPTLIFFVLAPGGLFSIGPALIAVGILAAATWWMQGGRRGVARLLGRERVFLGRLGRLCLGSPHRWWVLAFLACASPGLLRALLAPPLGWDALTYHAVKAGMWIQNAGFDSMVGPGTWAYYRNMLGGGEILPAWAMLPMHADTLTGVVEVGQWLGLGLSVMVLGRQLGVREPFGSIGAAFVLSIPTVKLILGSGYVELGLLLSLVGGLALALAGFSRAPGLLALAGAGLGVAAATKLPAVPVGGGILLLVLGRSFLKGTRAERSYALVGALAFAAALGPWMLLTYQRTGAPFAPYPFRLGGLVVGEAPPEVGWYLDRPIPAPSALAAETGSLMQVFHLPTSRSEALGLFTLIPLAVAPFGVRALLRRNPFGAILIGFVVAVSLLSYFSPGFAPIRYRWSDSSSRFLLPVVVLAVVTSLAGLRSGSGWSRGYANVLRAVSTFLLVFYAFYGFSQASLLGTAVLLVGLIVLVAVARYATRIRRAVACASVPFVLCVLGVTGLGVLRDALRYPIIGMDVALHVTPRYWAKALPMADRPREPHRIAVTSGPWQDLDNWFAYPFMGRRLQNRVLYVPVARDGTIGNFARGTTNEEIARTADFDAWVARLEELNVTEVMSFKPASLELSWMDGHPARFERLVGLDGYWGLYRVLRAPPSIAEGRDDVPPSR